MQSPTFIADIISADNTEQADADAVKAGTDLDCGRAYQDLVKAVNDRLLPESTLDQSLVRLFTARMRLGMFDPPAMVRVQCDSIFRGEFACAP